MKEVFSAVGCLIAIVLLVIVGLASGLFSRWFGQESDKFFKPRRAEIEREVYENTPSYVQGKVQQLTKLRFSYETADGDHRQSLKEMILIEASTVDNTLLPPTLRSFLLSL